MRMSIQIAGRKRKEDRKGMDETGLDGFVFLGDMAVSWLDTLSHRD